MKRLLVLALLVTATVARGQQFALYNTKTLFDAAENPARKVYTQDTSRQFSFNFLPNLSLNVAASGPASESLRRAIATDVYTMRDLELGKNRYNRGFVNFNTYVAIARMYTSVLKHGEAGFSWQIRSDTYAKTTNETLAILDNYKLFDTLANYSDPYNSRANTVNYQQISFSYRQNVTKALGVGVKLSYLSGILYTGIAIDSSSMGPNLDTETYDVYLSGRLRSSFPFRAGDEKTNSSLFKNPGFSTTVAFTNKMKYGWNVYGQVKDLGFILWRNSPVYTFGGPIALRSTGSGRTPKIGGKLDSLILGVRDSVPRRNFITPTNAKAEVVVTKEYEHYRASLLLSKNLTNFGGDIGIIQNASWRSLNLGVSTVYSSIKALQIGVMGMIKTRGFEIFGGSDQLFKMTSMIKGITSDEPVYSPYTKGYSGASIYLGIGFNFGRVVEHPWYSNRIPGIN